MVSRAIQAEIVYMFRLLGSTLPNLRASAEQRSDYYLYKAHVYEALAFAEPANAANALNIRDNALSEAHAINLDY
jgi:hypothetical protein